MSGLSGKPDVMWFPGRFWEANSVADFWSKWNPAVHCMYFELLRWVRRKTRLRAVVLPTILAIFLLTGLLHDGFVWLFIPGKNGLGYSWTTFFLMNAVIVIVERASRVSISLPTTIKKILTFGWLIGSYCLALAINGLLR